MRTLGALSLVAVLAGLSACAEIAPQRVDSSDPTVTYRFKPEDAQVASNNAANYCAEHYSGRAQVVSRQTEGSTYTATFRCVRQ